MDTSTYLLKAYNLYDSIAIKSIRSLLSGVVIDSSPAELQVQYSRDSYLFVYRFGSLVFFNVDSATMEREIGCIRAVLGDGLVKPTVETFHVKAGSAVEHVEFEYVELTALTLQSLRLIAVTVGQSAALEFFEINADQMLRETADFMQKLALVGSVPLRSRILLKFIGSAAVIRQHIIANLAILDPPEETWESQQRQKLFEEVQQNFDIEVRSRTLDRKLEIVQDNLEILADLASTRRAAILEFLVVILIVVEIGLAVFRRG